MSPQKNIVNNDGTNLFLIVCLVHEKFRYTQPWIISQGSMGIQSILKVIISCHWWPFEMNPRLPYSFLKFFLNIAVCMCAHACVCARLPVDTPMEVRTVSESWCWGQKSSSQAWRKLISPEQKHFVFAKVSNRLSQCVLSWKVKSQ